MMYIQQQQQKTQFGSGYPVSVIEQLINDVDVGGDKTRG